MTPSVLLVALLAAAAPAAPPVTAAAYRPDGQLLATAAGPVVYLIDPTTGDVLAELPAQSGRVTAVALSAEALAVAAGEPGKAGVVRVFDVRDPKNPTLAKEIGAHADAVYGLAFSPDGHTLATAGYDKLVKVWAVKPSARRGPLLTLTDHSDAVYAVAFHPKGHLIATGSADRAVKVWDATTGKRLYTLSDPTDWVYAVAWSPDGRRLAAGGVDKSIRTWDVDAEGGRLVGSAFAHGRGVSRVAYTADGKALVTLGEDRVVKVWDAAKLAETRALPAQPHDVLALAVRADGKQLALGRFDGALVLLDPATGKPTATPLPQKPKPATVSKASPDALIRDKVTSVTFEGTRLDEVTAVISEPAGVVAKLTKGTPTKLVVGVTVPATMPVGAVKLFLESPAGRSEAVRVWLDRFPFIPERGPNDSARQSLSLSLPETVVGSLDRPGDTDFYRFAATAGQQLGVQVTTDAPRARFDPVVVLTDESGAVLAEGADGRLGYVCPAAGTYCVGVRDREYRGGADFAYRAHVGPVPVVTGVFPLGVARGVATEVRVTGVNLGGAAQLVVKVSPPADAAVGSKVAVPVGDAVGTAEVTVGEFPEVSVPAAGAVTLAAVPGSADGLLAKPGDAHLVRFRAKKGQPLVIETHAGRLGSPTDTFVEVLDAAGKPVQRAVLRCTAKTFVTFRDHSSSSPGIRLDAWNELGIDDFLYVGGDLMRIRALPRGPDDDAQFYEVDGKRVGYLGTTPTHHAQGTPMYKVEAHPPGTSFPPNGMPLFPVFFRNDDGGPGHGKDSRIAFDPPADGDYVVRVSDANGAGGPTHAYRLTVRPPKPDFTVRVSPNGPKVWQGNGLPVTVTATRLDGFDGPIAVRFEGVAAPFNLPNTVIEAGQHTAVVSLSAGGKGKSGSVRVVATATVGGKEVTRTADLGTPTVVPAGDLVTSLAAPELVIRPGAEARFVVKVERRQGHTGRVPIEVRGLPHGVRVLNVGLSGILVLPGESEREVVLYAEPWVKPTERPVVVLARSERKNSEHAAPSVVLRVGK